MNLLAKRLSKTDKIAGFLSSGTPSQAPCKEGVIKENSVSKREV
jgi:hypothetical protein